MSTTRRTPNLTDRGHGIGQHYYNDSVDIDRRIVSVRQIIVWDVFGESMHRFDLDTRAVTLPVSATYWALGIPIVVARWTWEQVEEVVARDLATLPTPVAFGERYGSFQTETWYGTYLGRRPRGMALDEWEAKKALPFSR